MSISRTTQVVMTKNILQSIGCTRGALMNRTYENSYELIKNMVMNSCQWPTKQYRYGQKPSTVKAV
ncbi:hypothetical protein EPI10_020731 [Gossypium australe]|uniref:Uncharacterized protein n=1 Tax=Gossypium australe TaxID=47621 RepID=A0A5B6WFS2_9ROSI|nr:hypothetical protein EPI10_020731 [Gossypium australe]